MAQKMVRRWVWRRPVGQGFSGPVVSNGKLILFHRIENKEVVECLDAKTGEGLIGPIIIRRLIATTSVLTKGLAPHRLSRKIASNTFGAEGVSFLF